MTATLAATALSDAMKGEMWLERWQGALINWVRGNRPDLSNRQLAVLLIVATGPAPHTVRGLAANLNISKTAVSRALDRLAEVDYLRRVPDRTDRRNVFIVVTRLGEAFVNDLAEDLQRASPGPAKQKQHARP